MDFADDDKEAGRLVVGVPGVASAEIPVRASLLAWFARLFRGATVGEGGRVVGARAHVYVSEDDNGTADVYLTLVNVGAQPLEVEQLSLQKFLASGGELPAVSPVLTPLRNALPPGGVIEVHFRASLGAPAIRQLLRTVQKAQNLWSSPRVQLVFIGNLTIRLAKRRSWVEFSVGTVTPELILSCPSVGRE